ncbi:MAG TPA: response regulator [Candidatus Dormibacteraeota bacterium]|nr:response regulator [Candidatus Dormibacteraeota bacterium]
MARKTHPVDDSIRVLFAEDDPAVAEMYKLKLELDGYQVTIVSGGEQLISASAVLRPDLVFLDIRRREDDGINLLRALRAGEATRDVPVIILSDHRPQEMASRGFTADAMDYVVRADAALASVTRNLDDWAPPEPA